MNKLTDSYAELLETQTWLEFAVACSYADKAEVTKLDKEYLALAQSILAVIDHSNKWYASGNSKLKTTKKSVNLK